MNTLNKITTLNKLVNNLVIDSLFVDTNRNTLNESDIRRLCKQSIKYDLGRYDVTMKNKSNTAACPIWYVTRSDSNGKYIQLFCINEQQLNESDKAIYNQIIATFKNNVKS